METGDGETQGRGIRIPGFSNNKLSDSFPPHRSWSANEGRRPMLPPMLLIYVLLTGSAEVTYLLFALIGIPVSREGFVFQLPGMNVEIAKQCSGIRSSLALVITGILAAHHLLKSGWKKAIFIFSIFPIAILKNGIRIITLSALAIYVDEKFITQGFLHKSGGFVFFLLALGILGLILWGLRGTEIKDRGTRGNGDTEIKRHGGAEKIVM